MPRLPRCVAALAGTLSLLAGLLVAATFAPAAAGAYPSANVDFAGHGWGHGRGMGQWGALGYAVDSGWSADQILGHYYSNTTDGSLDGNPQITVQLKKEDGLDTLVQQERGEMTVSASGLSLACQAGAPCAYRAQRVGTNTFQLYAASDCGGGPTGWQSVALVQGPITFSPTAPTDDHSTMIQVCEANPAAYRWYRGEILAVDGPITVNRVDMESYLKGVVPRESPASWGSLSNGMAALRAQAVAARSYAWAENRSTAAKTCDTTSCQVYGGRAVQTTSYVDLEDSRTNQAIADTAGHVRMLSGDVARTEFSASTGGWTAGGTFPAIADDGDGICIQNACNGNHDWTASIPVSAIEARYGKGTLQRVEITQRNGLGADGGRVTSMDLVFSGGTVTTTGASFQSAFSASLKSNWFSVVHQASFPYHAVTSTGDVYAIGGAQFHGSMATVGVRTTIRDIAEGPGGGYWLLGYDGGVFSFDVPFYGSMGGQHLNKPVVGMEASASHGGYWLVATDGGIFSFGDAPFYGSTGDIRLNAPIVGMKPNGPGTGYWLVATDGGIFTYGDAPFLGSTGDIRLNRPMFAMAPTPSGNGYWLVAQDGGVFCFGDAQFLGSLPGIGVNETAVEMLPSPTGNGYLIVTSQGHVWGFGDASGAGGPADYGATAATVGAGVPVP
ncbi:MAG TPA: SpoIID/LytB domain-containing protein [Acidimicrobiales bacterium]|nr:SpoIID/LytB domain-containing protein [Acidimicrobiales bacterium]